ncbi:MAG TPA: multidrug transporter subunit MdtA, partial [Pseudomonadota bacterium]|nr:multidrug transporter subunit MdtA [Pseudomonadota bacterium]
TTDNQIDTTTGTIRLKASFPNTDHALFPNQFVNVKLLVDTLRNTVLVPSAAVQSNTLGTFVYVVKQNHTVDARKAVIAGTQGETTAIASGVQSGDLVVVDGLDKLQQGTRVSVQYTPGNRPSGQNANILPGEFGQ